MSVIYKYTVKPGSEVQTVTMPSSSTVLSAIEQDGEVVIYALIPNPYAGHNWDDEKRILVLGTGWEFDANIEYHVELGEMRFISTVKSGVFVWHVFEIIDRSPTE